MGWLIYNIIVIAVGIALISVPFLIRQSGSPDSGAVHAAPVPAKPAADSSTDLTDPADSADPVDELADEPDTVPEPPPPPPPEEESNPYMEGIITEVPYWTDGYIYAYSEINNALPKQKQFYQHFKNRFMNGDFLDLKGNTNYAFILMYDLLNEYDANRNIDELEKQLKLLSQRYPKVKSYASPLLIRKMKEAGYSERAEILYEDEHEYWKLGVRYRKQLQLGRDEVKHLNSLHYSSNKFNSVSFCLTEIVKLYRAVIGGLEKRPVYRDAIIYGFRQNGRYLSQNVWKSYAFIFRQCENAVREHYGVAKLSADGNETAYSKTKNITETVDSIQDFICNILPADRNTEMILDYNYPARWKKLMKRLEKDCESGSSLFDGLVRLCAPDCIPESVFHDAATFMLKHDVEAAIKLYFHYLDSIVRNRKTVTEDILHSLTVNQEPGEDPALSQIYALNIKIVKLLKPEQLLTFNGILEKFVKNRNLNEAVDSIPEIYRRRVRIDSERIEKIRQQHAESIEILNEYLDDGTEEESVNSDVGRDISPENAAIPFSQVQMAVLNMFGNGDCSALQRDVEACARSNGVLKNQIVESINDMCYERLDDVLIEEDGEYYTVNPEYYKMIYA